MNIYIKKLTVKDFQKVLKWKSDPQLSLEIMSQFNILGEEQVINWIISNSENLDQRLNGIYVQFEDDEIHCIGITRLMFIDWEAKTCEFGIYLGDRNYQGLGIGKKALELTIKQAFQDLELNKIYLKVNSNNVRAITLYENFKFITEGIQKEHFLNPSTDKYEDIVYMALYNQF
jgi:RimJ/RimL family protein N-acetyltransferase